MVSYNTTALGISLAESFIVGLLVTYILMPWVREGATAPSIEAETMSPLNMSNMRRRGTFDRSVNISKASSNVNGNPTGFP
jgi:hypothetical protein